MKNLLITSTLVLCSKVLPKYKDNGYNPICDVSLHQN